MSKPHGKPIERHPRDVTLPPFWHATHNFGIPYRPKDKPIQEDWKSVAQKFGVGVKELIWFNFQTLDPDEVNWYLHHYTGCNKVSPSGNNWMFSNSANPGIIYIPPADDEEFDFNAIETCVWIPGDIKKFMLRLDTIAKGLSGNKGDRIKKLVQVMFRAGYPACRDLWYYNDMVISVYADWKTDPAKRREMAKATGGAFPFDGDSGVYGQAGSEERNRGKWRIHAVNSLFDEFACGYSDVAAIEDRLKSIDEEMYKGWYILSLVGSTQQHGDLIDTQIWDFVNHVRLLAQDDTHLYSAFA